MAKKCGCSRFLGIHHHRAADSGPMKGEYVRLKVNDRPWMWAIRKPGIRVIRGTPTGTWLEVTEEGNLPGQGTKRSPTTKTFIVASLHEVKEKPASMCLFYGTLTTLEP